MTATKKLFHAIVVIGMATAGSACSSGTTNPPEDASTGNDATGSKDTGSTQDVATADTGSGTDAGGDGMPAWLGC